MSEKMTREQFAALMNDDLKNEYKHFHFYVHSAVVVRGLHRHELGEFFEEEAASEMGHILEFGKAIVGLDGDPNTLPSEFPTDLRRPDDILTYILNMEQEVVERYATRIEQAEAMGGEDGRFLAEFYAEQIMDSRKTVDHVRPMIEF